MCELLKRQGVCRVFFYVWRDITPALGGSRAFLALILPPFFAFVLNIDFSLIFFRFRRGFGRVLGCQNGRKIDIFGTFLDMLVETSIFIEFC